MTPIQSVNMKATRLTVKAANFVKVWRNKKNNNQKKYSKVFPYRKGKTLIIINRRNTVRSFPFVKGKTLIIIINKRNTVRSFPFVKGKTLIIKMSIVLEQLRGLSFCNVKYMFK